MASELICIFIIYKRGAVAPPLVSDYSASAKTVEFPLFYSLYLQLGLAANGSAAAAHTHCA